MKKSCGVRENELRFSQELRDGDRRETVSSVILRLVADAEHGQGQAIAALKYAVRKWRQIFRHASLSATSQNK